MQPLRRPFFPAAECAAVANVAALYNGLLFSLFGKCRY
jgi:hypothetical protein